MNDIQNRHRDFLKNFSIFKDFHPNELLILVSHLKERRFDKGQVLFNEGDPGNSCFFIVFGSVAIIKELPNGKHQPLAAMKSGKMFGQVSLLDGEARSAMVVSTGRTLLLELDKESFDRMFAKKETFAFRFQDLLTRIMTSQVRQANEKLTSLVQTAPKRNTDAELEQVSIDVKDAMRSVKEMGIDLDEVDYVVAEGQRRPELRRNAKKKNPAREKARDTIAEMSQAKAPGKHETMSINIDNIEVLELEGDFEDDGSYSMTRRKR